MLLNPFRQGAIHHLAISASASGANEILAAVEGKRLLVKSYTIFSAGAVTAKFTDGADDLTGDLVMAAGDFISSGQSEFGQFATGAGQALILDLGASVQVSGHATVIEIEEI